MHSLPLVHRIGAMTQLSIDAILIGQRSTREELTTVNTTRLEELLRRYHIGSWVHSPTSERRVPGWGGPNAREWNEIIGQIQLYSTLIDGVPALYGIDHIHGANFVSGATIFPHQLTSASSFNRALIELMGAITAKDTRAAGIPWVFAPTLDVAVQPAWSRVFETFGECPFVVSELGGALIRGLQGVQDEDGRPAIHRPDKVAATFKNFIGGSNPRNGANGAESWIPDRQLLDLFLPPFSAAIQQHQVASGMLADNSINGVPLATDSTLASRMLRDALSFNGTLVTAPDALFSLQSVHRLTASQHDAISLAMRTSSIDIASMNGRVDEWFDSLLQLVETEVIPVARVNLAAARVLQLKKDLGLATSFPASEIYSKESRAKEQEEMIRTVGSQADRDIALALAHESIVLLQNDGLLPVEVRSRSAASPIRKILVVGPTGDSIARQSGGWTFHRTGAAAEDEFPFGSSIFGGVKRLVKQIADSDDEVSVTYETGVEIDGSYTDEQLSRALKAADEADLVIACLGEDAYAEESGPITSLSLPAGQQHLLSELTRLASRAGATTSKTPSLSLKSLVAVLVQGRPRLLDLVELSRVRAILHAGLLGPEGGQAVADVIFGIVNPSGRLPITYPKHTADQPLQYYHTHSEAGHFAPQWEFGHGLSFTRFEYAELKMSASAIDPNDHLTVSVRVTNVGAVAGQETVLCFLSDLHRIVAPEVKRLRGFEKITLKPRESQVVTFTIGYVSAQRRQRVLYGVSSSLSH